MVAAATGGPELAAGVSKRLMACARRLPKALGMTLPLPFRLRALAAALAGLALAAGAGEAWVPVGGAIGQPMEFFIEAATVRRQGEMTHYRLVGRETRNPERATLIESEVGVDCARQRRVEYVTTTRWRGGVLTETAAELRPVAPGGRTARELDLACRLAEQPPPAPAAVVVAAPPSDGPGAATVPAVAAPLPARPALPAAVRWSGTGFAVDRSTLVTNHHVVRGCERLVALRGEERYAARVVATDAANDLAAVVLQGVELQPLALAAGPQELGEAVTVLGYPLPGVLGPQLRVTTGVVSSLQGLAGEDRAMQISAAVQSGNSGGPVLDPWGRVAGVVARKLDARLGAENVGFAVRLQPLRTFLQDHALPASQAPAAAGAPPSVADVVRRSAPSVLLVTCS